MAAVGTAGTAAVGTADTVVVGTAGTAVVGTADTAVEGTAVPAVEDTAAGTAVPADSADAYSSFSLSLSAVADTADYTAGSAHIVDTAHQHHSIHKALN